MNDYDYCLSGLCNCSKCEYMKNYSYITMNNEWIECSICSVKINPKQIHEKQNKKICLMCNNAIKRGWSNE